MWPSFELLGNAVNLYRTDKLGYPKAVDFSSGNYWFTDIAPYLQTVFAAVDDKKETPYRCPSVKARTWPFIDYAVNGYMLPAETAKDDVPFMKIDRPSTTFLLADSVAWISAPPTWFGEGRLDKQFEFRHANAANVVMFDGHVEKVTRQQLTDPKAEKRMKGLPE